jgi:hypothetical protein
LKAVGKAPHRARRNNKNNLILLSIRAVRCGTLKKQHAACNLGGLERVKSNQYFDLIRCRHRLRMQRQTPVFAMVFVQTV